MSSNLIKNKPVFDVENINLGSVIKIKNNVSPYQSDRDWRNAIVIDISYTGLTIVAYNGDNDVDELEIDISNVLNENYEIKLLEG